MTTLGQEEMKTIWRTIAILITGAVLLGTGYWVGTSHGQFSRLWASSVVSQSATKAAMLSTQLGQISEGKIDELRSLLNTQLDGEIVTLGTLIDWGNPNEGDFTAIKVLRRIAQQRSDVRIQNKDATIVERVNTIFEKAKAYPISEKQKP
jgi:hypothetical protein